MEMRAAKARIRAELDSLGLKNRITARMVSFADLAREQMVFVTIHDWKPNAVAEQLEVIARNNGFRVLLRVRCDRIRTTRVR